MGNARAESIRSERLTDVEIGFKDARLHPNAIRGR